MQIKAITLALTAVAALAGCQTTTGAGMTPAAAPVLTMSGQATIVPYGADAIHSAPTGVVGQLAAEFTPLLAAPQPTGHTLPRLAGYRCLPNTDWGSSVLDSEGDPTGTIGCKIGQSGNLGIFAWSTAYSGGNVTQAVTFSTFQGKDAQGNEIWHPVYDVQRQETTSGGHRLIRQRPHGIGPNGSPDHTDHRH